MFKSIVLFVFLFFLVYVMGKSSNIQQAPQPPPFKLTIGESIDRIKEEFSFLQAQYNR